MDAKYIARCCYKERDYGKSPMDGIGGTVKNKVFLCIICRSSREWCAILLKSIYLAARDILQEPNDVESCPKVHDTLEVLMVKPVFNENSACKLKFFRWLLTRSYFTSTGTNVKIMLKFATILFSHFLLTKIILVQGVKLLILIKKIGWNVIFLSNIFTNAVLWFKIQQYLCNPLQFSCETSTLTKIFNLQFHIFFIIIYL